MCRHTPRPFVFPQHRLTRMTGNARCRRETTTRRDGQAAAGIRSPPGMRGGSAPREATITAVWWCRRSSTCFDRWRASRSSTSAADRACWRPTSREPAPAARVWTRVAGSSRSHGVTTATRAVSSWAMPRGSTSYASSARRRSTRWSSCSASRTSIRSGRRSRRRPGRCGREGAAVLVMTHPCFRIPRQSGWGWDRRRRLQFRRVDHYLTPLAVPMKRYGEDGRQATRSHHRPLADYVNALASRGLLVDGAREIPSHRPPSPGPRAKAERRANREIPLLLGLRAVKQ